MPAYNAAETIEASIDSVIGQTYKDWELIVVDDASTDQTASIVAKYKANDSRVKLLSLAQNGWLPNARNQGIAIATGEYLAFLDADDSWAKDKLLKQMAFHQENAGVVLSHTDFDMFNVDGIKRRPFKNLIGRQYKKAGDLIPSIYCKNTIGVLTVMVKREQVVAAGCFDISMRTGEDQDLWIRLAENGAQFGYIDQKLALYRLNPGGITHHIGRYKRAYKQMLKKHRANAMHHKVYHLALANYYRYFGLFYSSKKNYRLAQLYLCAAMRTEGYLTDQLMTFGFYLLCVLKYGLSGFKK
jgi:teichuronic acid biosynthesis glycosyltransferase TuaG